jgi:NAD-dependent deacetylase
MYAHAQQQLVNWLHESRHAVMFTGAGLSTECGVPDFRSPGSPWMANKPIPFDAFVASAAARREAWRRKFAMDDSYSGAKPSSVHRLMGEWARLGRILGIITQNIDGLHQAGGAPAERLIELHGNGTYATCLNCGLRHELGDIRPQFEQTGRAPDCQACEGPVKSATISFGQRMPEAAMREADRWSRASDLFVVLGSSLVVHPAAQLPMVAKSAGARLAIVNREPTPLDPLADLIWRGEIADALAPLLDDANRHTP